MLPPNCPSSLPFLNIRDIGLSGLSKLHYSPIKGNAHPFSEPVGVRNRIALPRRGAVSRGNACWHLASFRVPYRGTRPGSFLFSEVSNVSTKDEANRAQRSKPIL